MMISKYRDSAECRNGFYIVKKGMVQKRDRIAFTFMRKNPGFRRVLFHREGWYLSNIILVRKFTNIDNNIEIMEGKYADEDELTARDDDGVDVYPKDAFQPGRI
jgi:hypothetical protein